MNATPDLVTKPAVKTPRPGTAAEAAASEGANLRRAALLVAVLVVVGVIAGLLPRLRQRTALRAETRDLALQTVSVITPAPAKAPAGLLLPGEIKPLLEAPIYARASGYLKRWTADIGTRVQAGDLLAEIDTPELNQELAQARAQLLQAEAALKLAKSTAARWTELHQTASVSDQDVAEKQADFELKTANLEAVRASVRRLEELQRFQKVVAPFAGTVTARRTDIGELIAAGSSKELFRLAQTDTLRVYVRVPQTAARGVILGQAAELTIPELPNRVFPAKVVRTSGAMSADSRTLLTELEVDNSRGDILAGSYAQVRFANAKLEAALTLPSNTLLFRAEGPQVGVVAAGDTVELRAVTLGRDFGPTIEILGGVTATDRVILNPSDSLVSGITVRVATATATAPTEAKPTH